MNSFKHFSFQSNPLTALLFIGTLAIYGCSGSSDSESSSMATSDSSIDASVLGESSVDNTATEIISLSDDPPTSDAASVSELPLQNMASELDESTVPDTPTDSPSSPLAVSPIVPEPSILSTVTVAFDITVPHYMSDSLQVRLNWGDINTTASWVRDENWAISEDFPANTENLLVVTFADQNGEIELGTYEQLLATTSGAEEIYLIQADQFDTDRWDADGDGISNLSELLAGSAPLIDESLSLEVREIENFELAIIRQYSSFYESSTPEQRPYFEDGQQSSSLKVDDVLIDIDEFGNGSYTVDTRFLDSSLAITNSDGTATRTNTASSIVWSGTYNYDEGFSLFYRSNFTTETRRIDEQNYNQESMIVSQSTRVGQTTLTYSLMGRVVDGSSRCQALSGAITYEPDSSLDSRRNRRTINKSMEELYWTVNEFDQSGQLIDEFLIRSLFGPAAQTNPPNQDFYCHFSDL